MSMMKKNYGSEQNIYRLFACGPSMARAATAAGAWKKRVSSASPIMLFNTIYVRCNQLLILEYRYPCTYHHLVLAWQPIRISKINYSPESSHVVISVLDDIFDCLIGYPKPHFCLIGEGES